MKADHVRRMENNTSYCNSQMSCQPVDQGCLSIFSQFYFENLPPFFKIGQTGLHFNQANLACRVPKQVRHASLSINCPSGRARRGQCTSLHLLPNIKQTRVLSISNLSLIVLCWVLKIRIVCLTLLRLVGVKSQI